MTRAAFQLLRLMSQQQGGPGRQRRLSRAPDVPSIDAVRNRLDQRFFDTPYYITPNDAVGQDAFAVIREAMRSKA
jgi:hypothetical protein